MQVRVLSMSTVYDAIGEVGDALRATCKRESEFDRIPIPEMTLIAPVSMRKEDFENLSRPEHYLP